MNATLSPRVRAAVSITSIIGVALCDRPWLLFTAWVVLLVVLIHARALVKHLQFATLLLLTIGVPLSIIWIGIRQAPPSGDPTVKDPRAATVFVIVVLLRLINITAITLACFTPISGDRLAPTLRSWGLRNNALLITLSSMFVGADLARCADQVLTARLARGFVVKRSRWAIMMQLPHILQPLLIRALRSAADRADLWRQRQLLKNLSATFVEAPRLGLIDTLATAVTLAWLIIAIAARVTP
jgi:energy-coupling factor transporter transmembrane protein EcfT